MDEDSRIARLTRPFFQRRAMQPHEWQLGLLILGLVVLGAWLILWQLIPTILTNLVTGIADLVSWVTSPAPPPTPTPLPVPTPSPSPLPSPSPIPV